MIQRNSPLIGFLTSVRLAVGLILYLIITCILASLIPQSRETAFYLERYGQSLGELITGSGFDTFFLSPLFLIPSGLFFVNLLSCTVARIFRRTRLRAPLRIGPDIIHAGILLIFIGGLVSLLGRQEGFTWFSEGQSAQLPSGHVLTVLQVDALVYEDGRPRDWVTRVQLSGQKIPPVVRVIEVNRPLRVGPYRIYQNSFTVSESGDQFYTGLLLVEDPGFPVILAALLTVCAGLILTFIQKLKGRL